LSNSAKAIWINNLQAYRTLAETRGRTQGPYAIPVWEINKQPKEEKSDFSKRTQFVGTAGSSQHPASNGLTQIR
jgi:hypothetical protein